MKSNKDEAKQISSSVLDMKFMQRSKNRLAMQQKKKEEAELKKVYIHDQPDVPEQTSNEQSSSETIVYSKDLSTLEDLSFGRLSFRGFNPDVEKLMVYYERLKNGFESDEEEEEDGVDVSVSEMAKKLGGTSSSIAKKFKSRQAKTEESDTIVEASGERLNFKDVRKRGHNPSWGEESPTPKFRKPAD